MTNRNFIAHLCKNSEGDTKLQTVSEHLYHTAFYAGASLKGICLQITGYLAGLCHDAGKCKDEYGTYLEKSFRGEPTAKGSVNHTFAGARFLLERYHRAEPEGYENLTAELLAYAVGAHHGLFDCVDERGRDGFLHRLQKQEIGYEESIEGFLRTCTSLDELDALFQKANGEVEAAFEKIAEITKDSEECSFYAGLLQRLLLSAVIEGDRRDTREFEKAIPFSDAEHTAPVDLWARNLRSVEEKTAALGADGAINAARHHFSQQARRLAEKPTGLYRLSLPTGGGKTLTSLRAALAHAAGQRKKRIIFVIPLLSILDQNSKEIRKYLADPEVLLEHHSNIIQEQPREELDQRELLIENWVSPIIITTLVQLLNTLFDGHTSCIRRFQALSECVLVIDEVQTVPPKLLTLFTLAMNFLVKVMGSTVILSSATQPPLELGEHAYYCEPEELVPFEPALWQAFQRTKLIPPETCKLDQLGAFVQRRATGSTLVITNTKREAASLYHQFEGLERYYLSTSLCMAHRRATLQKVEEAIAAKRPFLLASTQLMECGVDLDFNLVIRVLAGLDNLIQAAGRCNRNGKNALTEVPVVRLTDERLGPLKEIAAAQSAAEALFDVYRRDPAAFRGDPASQPAATFYYDKLYNEMKPGMRDGPLSGLPSLFELLAENEHFSYKCQEADRFWFRQAFKTAGEHFKVFDDNTTDILVPYGEGKKLISELSSQKGLWDIGYAEALIKRAQPYSVSVFSGEKNRLMEQGALAEINGVLILREGWYSEALGVLTDGPQFDFMEVK